MANLRNIEYYRNNLPTPNAAVKHQQHIGDLGQWLPLQPNQFSRPLTHTEMDYNMVYIKETLQGYRVMGSGSNGEVTNSDLGDSLIYHQISETDLDYDKWVSMGYSAGQRIWIFGCCASSVVPDTCAGFSVTASGTNAGWDCGEPTAGSLEILVAGGVQSGTGSPYSISFFNAEAPSVLINPSDEGVVGTYYVYTFNNLNAGDTYVYTVEDFNDPIPCNEIGSHVVQQDVNPCLSFNFTLGSTQATQGNEDATLTVSGFNGVAPYTLTFTGPTSILDRTVTTNSETVVITDLAAGTYSVEVAEDPTNQNSNCCSRTKSITTGQEFDPCADFNINSIQVTDETQN